MSGRGASDFGPLHIPFKKWGAAANLPHAHQFDQNMQRIEDWAERLRSEGMGGGVTPMMDGRRFRFDASADGAVLDATAIGIPLNSPQLEGAPGKRNYSTYLTGTFDLVVTATANGQPASAKYLIECWVQPTNWPELLSPISTQNFTWEGEGHVSISYEWMINWFWSRAPEYAEEFYGFEPPMNIDPVELIPQIRVTWIDAPGGDRQVTVGGEAVLHAFTMGNTEGVDSPGRRIDLDQVDVENGTPIRVPASTVAFSKPAPPTVKGWVFESTFAPINSGTSWPFWTDPVWVSHPTALTRDLSSKIFPIQSELSSDGPEVTLEDGEIVFHVGGDYRFTYTYTFNINDINPYPGSTVQTVGLFGVGWVSSWDSLGGAVDYYDKEVTESSPVVSVASSTSAPGQVVGDWNIVFEEGLVRYCLTHVQIQIEKVS